MDLKVKQDELALLAEFQNRNRVGLLTMVFTDMVGSTRLKQDLGDSAAVALIQKHHALVRQILNFYASGQEISTAGDSFFIVFANPSDAVKFALQVQAGLRNISRQTVRPLQDRIGIHIGEVLVEVGEGSDKPKDLSGIQVDTCARVMALGKANHILMTRFAFDNARQTLKGQSIEGVGSLNWVSHGFFHLKGVAEPLEICEVAEGGKTVIEPLTDSDKARRFVVDEGELARDLVTEEETASSKYSVNRLGDWLSRNLRHALMGALVVMASALICIMTPLVTWLSHLSYDLAFRVRASDPPEEVVIVYMDDPSHGELKQPWLQPWDRGVHADLLTRLTASKAKAVVFDVLFQHQDRDDPEGDQRLEEAAARNGEVYVAAVETVLIHQGVVVRQQIALPFEKLQPSVKWGIVERTETDRLVRRHYRPSPALQMPSLVEVVARHTMETPPAADSKPRWMNFYGPPGTIPNRSYGDVLKSNTIPDAVFADKVIFVGALYSVGFTGGKGTDDFLTPYSSWTKRKSPGAEILATAYVNLLRREWLTQYSPIKEFLLFMGFGALAGFGLTLCRPLWATLAGVMMAITLGVVACFMVWRTHTWFSWAMIGLVQIPMAVIWSVLINTMRLQKEKQALEKVVASRRMLSQTGRTAALAARATASNANGTVVDGAVAIPDHTMLYQIGRGAYGEVWLAEDVTGSFHAAKIVHRHSFQDSRPYEREFEGVRRFSPISRSHPGLIDILHVGRNEQQGYFYYVMEAADDIKTGQRISASAYAPRTLSQELARSNRLPLATCLELGVRLVEALDYLHHQGLIHRDIKPSNILFVQGAPKLADIGLVTEMARDGEGITLVGTEGYMSPEGPGAATADIYSLGKLLYEISMGKKPSDFPELPTAVEDSRDGRQLMRFNEIILRACHVKPSARFPNTDTFRQELLALQQTIHRENAS